MRLAAAVVGLWCALSTPRWLRAARLAVLRRPFPIAGSANAADGDYATRVSMRALAILARLPWSPWKNSCLYQSIAECLTRRYFGIPATIVIGVKNAAPPHGPIAAHAWVRRGDSQPAPEGFQELSGTPVSALTQ